MYFIPYLKRFSLFIKSKKHVKHKECNNQIDIAWLESMRWLCKQKSCQMKSQESIQKTDGYFKLI